MLNESIPIKNKIGVSGFSALSSCKLNKEYDGSLIQQFGESFKVINEYTVRYSLDKSVKLNLIKSFHGVSNSTKPLLGQLLGQLSDKISSNKPIKQD